jgi:hypothetical protein
MGRILLSSVGMRSKDGCNLLVGGEIDMRRFSGKPQFGLLDIGLMDRIYGFSCRVRTATAEQTGHTHSLQNMDQIEVRKCGRTTQRNAL